MHCNICSKEHVSALKMAIAFQVFQKQYVTFPSISKTMCSFSKYSQNNMKHFQVFPSNM